MKVLEVELGKSIIILFIILFSCKENKVIQERDRNDKISVEVLSIEKKKELSNISILVDNYNNDKYVMLFKYHGFEGKETYPEVIESAKETIIDYNFFLKNHIQDSISDPSIQNTNESFTLFIVPKGKTKITLKGIPISNTMNKKYLYLYFSKMKEETFKALPKKTSEYDIIANEKGFRNYKFSKEIIVFW